MKLFILFSLLIMAAAIRGQQPAPQDSKHGEPPRKIEDYVAAMEDAQRVAGFQVDKTLRALKIKKGSKIADIGAGTGIFTFPMSKMIGGQGKVYAVEVRRDLVDLLDDQVKKRGSSNISPMLAPFDDPKLPEKVDLILIVDTLHHIENQPAYLKKLDAYLNPGGRIAIIDYKKNWPANHEKSAFSVADLDGWMRDAGFEESENHEFLEDNFFVVFRRAAKKK